MSIDKFLQTLDAVRYDTGLDEMPGGAELRGRAQTLYPAIARLIREMQNLGLLTD